MLLDLIHPTLPAALGALVVSPGGDLFVVHENPTCPAVALGTAREMVEPLLLSGCPLCRNTAQVAAFTAAVTALQHVLEGVEGELADALVDWPSENESWYSSLPSILHRYDPLWQAPSAARIQGWRPDEDNLPSELHQLLVDHAGRVLARMFDDVLPDRHFSGDHLALCSVDLLQGAAPLEFAATRPHLLLDSEDGTLALVSLSRETLEAVQAEHVRRSGHRRRHYHSPGVVLTTRYNVEHLTTDTFREVWPLVVEVLHTQEGRLSLDEVIDVVVPAITGPAPAPTHQ